MRDARRKREMPPPDTETADAAGTPPANPEHDGRPYQPVDAAGGGGDPSIDASGGGDPSIDNLHGQEETVVEEEDMAPPIGEGARAKQAHPGMPNPPPANRGEPPEMGDSEMMSEQGGTPSPRHDSRLDHDDESRGRGDPDLLGRVKFERLNRSGMRLLDRQLRRERLPEDVAFSMRKVPSYGLPVI